MKILAVSDEEAPVLYDYYRPGVLDDYDLILACGDLRKGYLEFLVTMAHCPVVYVPGNHDEKFVKEPPEGCICADGTIVKVNGIRILGLGGCHKYRKGSFMYSEAEMKHRIRSLWFALWKNHGFDILLTHAPARHINDFETESHKGFDCFGELIEKYQPRFFVHGHVHRNYGVNIPRVTQMEGTTVVNACGYYSFDWE